MTILVTGGAGYIGSHMVHALRDAGERVVVVDNLITGFKNAVPEGVALAIGNIGDEIFIERLVAEQNVEAIVHFAASSVVPESIRDPLMYYKNNTSASRSLIEGAIKGGVKKFIFSSTAAVYGNPEQSIPLSEDAPKKPISPYGTSKLMTEMLLADVGQAYEFKYAALRYFNVAGADPSGRVGQSTRNATHLIKSAVQAALGYRSRIEVYGTDYATADGTCVRDYIHVSDLVDAHASVLKYLRDGGENLTINCGYGRGYSVLEVIDSVKRVSGRNFEVAFADRRPGDPESIVADVRKAHSMITWKPSYDNLDTIVEHALAWEIRMATSHFC
ncbi:UDP-glucose 4-epimerase [Tardiphaga sp. OK246]|uniref:UDP-glucose 4-epimerase GalE n=1 Tax=Tardiphaga sp. OK246 TaxID=1855307 RepID=UPI000B637303|nr:UDP-glucose 4-epimerase GalE [Tardiphaga sp. OK246]SNT63935.1 UDP-glucose 4-epimerase [Tardiphaga sp. OK246]